ncbi:MAG: M48 family metallopeptidase [Mycobacteriales bacterium]
MSTRTVAAIVLAGLLAALALGIARTTPRHVRPDPPGGHTPVSVSRDFTPAQVARESAFHRALRPGSYAALLTSLVLAGVLGLTPLGARLVGLVGGGWLRQALWGAVALTVLGQALTLPFAAWSQHVRRRYGLSRQPWSGWAGDVVKSVLLAAVLTMVVAVAFVGLARAFPRSWWVWTAGGAAALVVALSFGYPLVVEPLFNKFTPMAAGPLRTDLLDLAARDHVRVSDVLVADASRRTTALNAYVSGFGASRRIVVYDTLLRDASPEEVRLVVAHELGHAKRQDVLYGTVLGALGAAAAMVAAYLLLGWSRLLAAAGVDGPGDARVLPLLFLLAALAGLATQPAQAWVSRQIEARADRHALDLTRDPDTFVTMQKRLAVTNLSDLDPNPVDYLLFTDHPTAPGRIAMARDWAAAHAAEGRR